MSSFGGLGIARTGLFASQKGLDVVSQNIANANTVGYTRQRILTTPFGYDLGVLFLGVEQIRDSFIDNHFRSESSLNSEYQVKADALTMMEDYFQEPSDNSLGQAISNFFNSLQEMSMSPETEEMRSQVMQNALIVTDTMHYIYNKLTELQQNQNSEVQNTVDQINMHATNLAVLNEQIVKQEVSGQKANELRDERNNILDQLSKLIDIKTTEDKNGSVSVMIGGSYLVEGLQANEMTVAADKANPIEGESDLFTIRWSDSNEEVEVGGGKLKGILDIRDGTGVSSSDNLKMMGIPYFINKINLLAKSLAKSINDIHTTGYTLPNESNGNTSQTGVYFFEPIDAENQVTAKNISVSQDILENVLNIATSDVAVTDINVGNNNIIKQLAALRDNNNLTITVGSESYNIGSIEGFTKETAVGLAIVSSNFQSRLRAQQVIVESVENKRFSVMGVSIDEEMTNMIQFQHAYSAAARVITAIDRNLETLINMAR